MIKYNLSTYFLFPLLNLDIKLFRCDVKLPNYQYLSTRYVNTYIWDIEVETPEYSLCVVHRNIMDVGFTAFEDTLESMYNFVDSYDILEGNYGVKVFRIPQPFQKEKDLFLAGAYSKFSLEAKELCIKTAPITQKFSQTLPDIFNRKEELRAHQESKVGQSLPPDAELWSIPDVVKESLNYKSKQTLKDGVISYNRKVPLAK